MSNTVRQSFSTGSTTNFTVIRLNNVPLIRARTFKLILFGALHHHTPITELFFWGVLFSCRLRYFIQFFHRTKKHLPGQVTHAFSCHQTDVPICSTFKGILCLIFTWLILEALETFWREGVK